MRRPSNYPMTFGWGRYPDLQAAVDIYKQLGLKGHNGQDYASPTGAECYAITKALVKHAGWKDGGYGICVILEFTSTDGRRYEAVYAHLRSVAVSSGQVIDEGRVLGHTNNTGSSAGAHLHFAIRPIGANQHDGYYGYIDPEPFFQASGGAEDDMTNEQFIRLLAKVGQNQANYAKEALDHWVNSLNSGLDPETAMRQFLNEGDQYLSPFKALAIYDDARGGADPAQFAQDRILGGSSFEAVMREDIPVYTSRAAQTDRLEAQEAEQVATIDRLNTQAQEMHATVQAQEAQIRDLQAQLDRDASDPATPPTPSTPPASPSSEDQSFLAWLKRLFNWTGGEQ